MPPNEPIEQPIEVTGAEQSAADVQRVTDANERLGESVDRAGDQSDRAADQQRELADAQDRAGDQAAEAATQQRRAGDATDRAGDQADRAADQQRELAEAQRRQLDGVLASERATGRLGTAWQQLTRTAQTLGAAIGIGGIVGYLQTVRREIDLNTEATQRYAEATLNLQFLGDRFNEQERDFVGQASVLAGRDLAETASAFTALRSRRPNDTDQQAQALFLEAAETAQTTPASLNAIVDALVTIRQFEPDPRRTQNLLRSFIVQSGTDDPGQAGPLISRVLGTARGTGGLTTAEGVGSIAAATGLGLPTEVAGTGLNALILGLSGAGTSQGPELLRGAGVDTSGNFLDDLRGLADALQSGRLPNADLERIVGREGLAVAQAFADPDRSRDFFARVDAVVAAGNDERDLTREAIDEQFAVDEIGRLNLLLNRLNAAEAVLRGSDADALRERVQRQAELVGRLEQGQGPLGITVGQFLSNQNRTLLGSLERDFGLPGSGEAGDRASDALVEAQVDRLARRDRAADRASDGFQPFSPDDEAFFDEALRAFGGDAAPTGITIINNFNAPYIAGAGADPSIGDIEFQEGRDGR